MTRACSFSFPKERRLTHPAEFDHVKQSGIKQGSKLLGLNFAPVQSSAPCRVGFIVSRRIGGAVIRNRVRRRLREIVHRHQHDLRSGFWIVLVARRGAASASYHELEHELLRLARRASILL
jgi:ribonuclease P protein component